MRRAGAPLALLILTACAPAAASDPVPSPDTEVRYRVVRFHVKPDREAEFLRFFTESLVPAAEALAESSEVLQEDLDGFILLRPMAVEPGAPLTFYVLYRGPRVGGGRNVGGAVMRNLVHRAFPEDDARERVERWMATIDLESLQPTGADYERVLLGPFATRR